MAVISGKHGWIVDGQANLKHVRSFFINKTLTPSNVVHSSSRAGTTRRAGIQDYTGRIEMFQSYPGYMPGDYIVSMVGYIGANDESCTGTGPTVTLDCAIVTAVEVRWNYESGEVLNSLIEFAAGKPVMPVIGSGAMVVDNAVYPGEEICGLVPQWGYNPDFATAMQDWDNVSTVTLRVTNNTPTFNNSSTLCVTGRRPGIIDWEVNITEQNSTPTHDGLGAANLVIKLPTGLGANDSYRLAYNAQTDVNDIGTNAETGEIVSSTSIFRMSAQGGIGALPADGTLGLLAVPGQALVSAWWPIQYCQASACAFTPAMMMEAMKSGDPKTFLANEAVKNAEKNLEAAFAKQKGDLAKVGPLTPKQ